jgi:hypothetical protein
MTKKTKLTTAVGSLPAALLICGAVCGTAFGAPTRASSPPASTSTSVSPPASTSTSSPVAVCKAPTPGHDGCLALELVPSPGSPAAHAFSPRAEARARRAAQSAPSTTSSGAPFAQAVPATGAPATPAAEPADSWVEPAELHSAYGLPEDSPPAAGTQTIALVDAYNDLHAEADLRVYDEALHLPPCTTKNGCFKQVNQNGSEETSSLPFPASQQALENEEAVCKGTRAGDKEAACEEVEEAAGWGVEISTDLDVAHSVCENCRIGLVEAASAGYLDLEAAERTAERPASEHGVGATEISNSWGGEEPPIESEAFNRPGLVITAAAGDFGYRNWTQAEAAQAHHEPYYSGADYPASSPHVVAVGGTKLTLEKGIRVNESVWNEDPNPSGGDSGAGGGGCSTYFNAPAWQQAVPDWSEVGCGSKRAVADVAADGDPYTGVLVYDSTESEKDFIVIGGTSVASPIVAATFALAGGAQGVEYPAQTLYSHLGTAGLHDIVEGGNGRCVDLYSSGCSGSMSPSSARYPFDCGSGVLICNAGPGYDGPTGVGTPNGVGAFQPGGETAQQAEERRLREAREREKHESEARERAAAEAKAAELQRAEEETQATEQHATEASGSGTDAGSGSSPTGGASSPSQSGGGSGSSPTGGANALGNSALEPGLDDASSSNPPAKDAHPKTVGLSELALTLSAIDALNDRRPPISRIEFTFRLSAAARVRVTLAREVESRGRRHWRSEPGSFTYSAGRGRDRLHLGGRNGHSGLPPGLYRLTLAPAHGNAGSISFVLG